MTVPSSSHAPWWSVRLEVNTWDSQTLGTIKWDTAQRQFLFQPMPSRMFNARSLERISVFCADATRARRERKTR
jgi:hypothetical protein